MSYNLKYCSFYPNNFDASALRPRYAYTPTETRQLSKIFDIMRIP